MSEFLANIARLEAVLAEVRSATRDAHEVCRDLRSTMKEAKEIIDGLGPGIEKQLNEQVRIGIDEYRSTLDTAIERADKAMTERFDRLVGILTGNGAVDDDIERIVERAAERVVARLMTGGAR